MRHALRLAILTAGLAGLAGPAQAALFEDRDELARMQIEQLKQENAARFDKLEAQQRGQLELSNQIEQLRQEIARMRGQIEVLTYELDAAQKRQKDFYVDLDNRMRKMEESQAAAAAQPPAEGEPPQAARPDPAAESRDYEAALNLLKGGKYKEAGAAFEAFLAAYPESQYQPSASYWAGSAYFQARNLPKASEHFERILVRWPGDIRAPDAMLGLANCKQDGGDPKGARKTLESLVTKYPNTPAAQMAKQRLARRS